MREKRRREREKEGGREREITKCCDLFYDPKPAFYAIIISKRKWPSQATALKDIPYRTNICKWSHLEHKHMALNVTLSHMTHNVMSLSFSVVAPPHITA